jgi:predicted nucleotidyltransferase
VTRVPSGSYRRSAWNRLNPPATRSDVRRARRVARRIAFELSSGGDLAVVLAGSWARGDAHRASDVDLWAIAKRRDERRLWRDGFEVTITRSTVSTERRRMREPRLAGGAVPGWRSAILLHDPRGVARRLRTEARRFRWEAIATECDRWVAAQTVGWAEEAVKLVRALASGSLETAAVQRNLLADGLGFVMAVRARMFWDSENELWERIGGRVGGEWARAQRLALGVPRADLETSCRGALALYARTVDAVRDVLNAEQARIVARACRVAGEPLSPGRGSRRPGSDGARSRSVPSRGRCRRGVL